MSAEKYGLRQWLREQLERGNEIPPRRELAARFGCSLGYANKCRYEITKEFEAGRSEPEKMPVTRSKEFTATLSDDGGYLQWPATRITNVEELIEQCGIDLEGYVIDRKEIVKHEMGSTDADKNPQVTPMFNVRVKLKRDERARVLAVLKREVMQEISAKLPKPAKKAKLKRSGRLGLLAIPDIHFGKLSHTITTNDNYDLAGAVRRFEDAFTNLLERVKLEGVDRLLVVHNGDTLHTDNWLGTTTRGTRQDVSGHFLEIYRAARESMCKMLVSAAKVAPVEFKLMRGNHDHESAILLNEAIAGRFMAHKEILIDTGVYPRYPFTWGDDLLIFSHGDHLTQKKLSQVAPIEFRELWGKAKRVTAFTGHLHHSREMHFTPEYEDGGMIVITLPSLSGVDAWHAENGYFSQKAAHAYIFDSEEGQISRFRYVSK